MNTQELLKLRKHTKARNGTYVRSDGKKRLIISRTGWRRPKGHHSKIRLSHRGYDTLIQIGYGSPKEVKGLDKSGLIPVVVETLKQIESIDPKKQGIIIASVGMKKKVLLLEEAQKKKITVLNVKNAQNFMKKVEEKLKVRKEKRKNNFDSKSKKKTTIEKKVENVEEKDKKKEEKIEKDKIITQKEA